MGFINNLSWYHRYGLTRDDFVAFRDYPTVRRNLEGTHPALLYLEDISVSFSGFKALDIKTFYVNRGELRFLIGPNGAGKTTLLDVVCRKTEAAAGGRIMFDGLCDLRDFDIPGVARLGICRKFQAPSIFPNLSVLENMELAYPMAREVFSGLAFRQKAAAREEINAALKLIGLESLSGAVAGALSHGQKQWLEIGLTLLQRPVLLMVDEPVAGMSEREREETGLLLTDIAKNCSVLVVEHDMNFVREFSNVVTVLHAGKILCEGSFDRVSNDPEVIDVYLGRNAKAREGVAHA
jgi:urea transport system ATP-binding protein